MTKETITTRLRLRKPTSYVLLERIKFFSTRVRTQKCVRSTTFFFCFFFFLRLCSYPIFRIIFAGTGRTRYGTEKGDDDGENTTIGSIKRRRAAAV